MEPINADGLRKWAVGVNARLDNIERRSQVMGYTPRHGQGPYTEAQVAARMIHNGADAETAMRNAAAIFQRLRA